ncbi:ferritin-like domain-containing protein [Kocuria palustris]|uniref:ferritin-like domain-containing protein n=1 Tax=Kocuria palustris TaxID=71999 RepID=UPI00119E599E|nr:ferritin-like domain-containing protein [Kocuria palustris]
MAFDIDRFAATSHRVAWEDLDMDSFRRDPLPESSLRVLRYMCDVEFHTVCYLRDLLITPSHHDEDVSAFMTMWNREEFWHGEALAEVLGLHGIVVDYDEIKAKRVKLGWAEALKPLKQSLLSTLIGDDFVATHMTWGAANEYSAVAAYKRMAAIEEHPVLSELLVRIARQESRHVAFYSTQARQRLGDSVRAQRITRLAMRSAWRPVGSGVMSDAEVRHVMGHLFAGDEGREEMRKLDANIARLPGMGGLTLFQDVIDQDEDQAPAAEPAQRLSA